MGGDGATDSTLDFVSFDLARPGNDMEVRASIKSPSRFSSLSWGSFGMDGAFPYGVLAGGLQGGVVSLWNPYAIVNSQGADTGLIHSLSVHNGSVNKVAFHPSKPSLMATCGSDGEVNIVNVENPAQPELFKPSNNAKTHEGSEVLSCAWNQKVPHILASCSNQGTTVVWDLKQRKEVISFKDPASRARVSDVAWNPEKPTQLVVSYDDDRQPSLQMWDLRNVKYPFKETSGHSKGILGVSWNPTDPNLLMSCGKDNRTICWFNTPTSMETFCDIASPQANFEVKWAPHRPGLISAASFSGSVGIYSTMTQQISGCKYCPLWQRRPCGVSFGFGGRMLAFGTKQAAAAVAGQGQAGSWCQSLVVPNEPEIVATADLFEQWRNERRLQEFCFEQTRKSGGSGSHEALMWDIMGVQFEEHGRQRVPALLGFEQERIMQQAEQFLGQKPGSTLMEAPAQEEAAPPHCPSPAGMGPDLAMSDADDFFKTLADDTEKRKADEAAATIAAAAMAAAEMEKIPSSKPAGSSDWSEGPELLIKQSLLVGNLPAAVECCFKSGKLAEGLLLASGGGTTLWTRARDEFLRLQNDVFLTTVGNIMTNDFEKLVCNSNLGNWMETLAIIATYAGDQHPMLCEILAERLEKEMCDMRAAVICYICAKNFAKTVQIWSNTCVASFGSQKLALAGLVEKMAVLQEATKFNQGDALFNAKLTQYAEILANSGRLTAAMRYLCLLQDDSSSAILRDRIYNSAPVQMSQMFGRSPAFPFEMQDVRILYTPPAQPVAHQQPAMGHMGMHQQQHHQPQGHMAAAPTPAMGMPHPGAAAMPPRPMGGGMYPGSTMPPAPAVPGGMAGGYGAPAPMSAPTPAPAPAPNLGPAPRMNTGMPPAPNVGHSQPAPGMGGCGGGYGGMPTQPQPMQTQPQPMQPQPMPMQPQPMQPQAMQTGTGVLPPGQMNPGMGGGFGGPAPGGMSGGIPGGFPTGPAGGNPAGAGAAAPPAAPAGPVGEPMAPHDIEHCKNIFGMLLDYSSQDGNVKKREDIAKRLEDLYSKLASGAMKSAASQKVLQISKAAEAQDFASAKSLHKELTNTDWDTNKNWLQGVQRLINRA